jgi:two-component system CheB/CheR fusion protein
MAIKKQSNKSLKTAEGSKSDKPSATLPEKSFLMVGIGASAGGLLALETFFKSMPSDSQIGFVIVQHMDPTHKSLLSELLQKHTKMEVKEAEDGVKVKANHVYIIPPNKDMALFNGKLQLSDPKDVRGQRKPIDYFLRSLAMDQHEKAVAIILSGTGTEGTLGSKAIKGEGGLVIIQDPEQAAYDGMPRSAIAANVMDYVLAVENMPAELLKFQKQKRISPPERAKSVNIPANLLEKIFFLLRSQTGHDFSQYKQNTINRRIEKRMAVNQINKLVDYVKYLQKEPKEINELFSAITIGVTSFFRDIDAFELLKTKIIPSILNNREPDETIRIWVPGCSSGEEAYSIAMLIQEYLEEHNKRMKVNIFATDLDPEAIEIARIGRYPEGINVDLSPEYLKRFFTYSDHHYKADKSIRNMVVFAVQNLTQDPPFSKLDMISCRNLLIYLNSNLQKKVFPLFHYSLLPNGTLFLGSSETIGEFSDLFSISDRKWKIFKKKGVSALPARVNFNMRTLRENPPDHVSQTENTVVAKKVQLGDFLEKTLLKEYAPASVVIDNHDNALYFFGNTGKYLQPVSGEASLNILNMARPGLKLELSATIRRARKESKTVIESGITVQTNGSTQLVRIKIRSAGDAESDNSLLLISFEDVVVLEGQDSKLPKTNTASKTHLMDLEHDLASTKEYLQTTVEELETSNEELQSSNEELQSSNEELQSTNEELETSKEELQSLNEETITMNSELHNKIDSLGQSQDDLSNLMASIQVGIIFLDTNLKIKKFTPSVTNVIPLIYTDLGRPISNFTSELLYQNMSKDAEQVLDTLAPFEKEVQAKDGTWYDLRITPYRTTENVIQGVVVTFIDVSKQKRDAITLKRVNEHLNLIMEALPAIPYVAASTAGYNLMFVGESVQSVTGFAPNKFITDGDFFVKNVHPDDKKKVLSNLDKSSIDEFSDHEFRWKCSNGQYRRFINFIRRVKPADGREEMLMGIWQDVTAMRLSENELKLAFDVIKEELANLKKAGKLQLPG